MDLVGHLSAHGPHVERARCDGLKGRIIQRLHDAGSPALKLLPGDALPVLHVHQGRQRGLVVAPSARLAGYLNRGIAARPLAGAPTVVMAYLLIPWRA